MLRTGNWDVDCIACEPASPLLPGREVLGSFYECYSIPRSTRHFHQI